MMIPSPTSDPVAHAVLLDFETANPDSKLLKQAGAWRYSEDPLTEILCCVFAYGADKYVWAPSRRGNEDVLRRLAADADCAFISHGEFEIAIWRNIMVPMWGFADVANERWHDTMATCGMKGLPLALESAADALKLPVKKDTEGRRFTLGLAKPSKMGIFERSEQAIGRVIRYCGQDVDAEMALHGALGPLPDDEEQAFRLHQRMNQRGLRLDLAYIEASQEVVRRASGPLVKRFKELTGYNPTQVRKLTEKYNLDSMDAEHVEDMLDGELADDLREALQIRQLIASSSIKKLPRMAACICEDGRARGLSQFHGTMPGRCAGRLWQPYNLPRPPEEWEGIEPGTIVDAIMTGDPDYVECVLGTPPIPSVGYGLRHAIIPAPRKVFLSGDYAGIQLRIYLKLAGQEDKLAMVAAGKDVYADMASVIYKQPVEKKKDPEKRHAGKNTVLGAGFGMGAERFHKTYCRKEPFEFAERQIEAYREEWAPMVPQFWYAQFDTVCAVVQDRKPRGIGGLEYSMRDDWLILRLPSGRLLWYRQPEVSQVNKWGRIRNQLTIQGARTREHVHGGMLFENAVMGMEVDIQRHGWANCEANGFPIVHETYDELVAEVSERGADLQGFRQCMLDLPQWVKDAGIPIAVPDDSIWQGDRYRK